MALDACRSRLNLAALPMEPHGFHHPGLVLDRYLEYTDDDHAAQKELYEIVERSAAREMYRHAYNRWRKIVQNRPGCHSALGTLASPMAIGLGNESVMEVGLTTHHTYGMPVIPGSALKGLCARGLREWRAAAGQALTEEKFKELKVGLFGNTDQASGLTFWDAWYDHESFKAPQLPSPYRRDVITVHHPAYYQAGASWPTDFDDPTPVPFLTVAAKARFLFALDAPPGWHDFVLSLLKWSLIHFGVGGKTNAGYGFFDEASWSDLPFAAVVKFEVLAGCILVGDADYAYYTTSEGKEVDLPAEWALLAKTWTPAQWQTAGTDGLPVTITLRENGGKPIIETIVPA